MNSYGNNTDYKKSKEEQLELFNSYKETGDIEYKKKLIESLIPLAIYKARMAQSFYPRMEFDDICQSILLGISDSIENFDPEKGTLTSFAEKYMLGAIQEFGSYNDSIGYKHNEVIKIGEYFKAREKLIDESKTVDIDKISEETGYNKKTILGLESIIGNQSLDKELSDGFNLYDIVEGSTIDKLSLNVHYIQEVMEVYIGEDNTDMVLDYHMHDVTLSDISDKYNLSIEGVRKRINQSVKKLREVFNN